MRRDAWSRFSSARLAPLAPALLLMTLTFTLGTTPTTGSAQDAKIQKLVFASAGFEDSNRFWMVGCILPTLI